MTSLSASPDARRAALASSKLPRLGLASATPCETQLTYARAWRSLTDSFAACFRALASVLLLSLLLLLKKDIFDDSKAEICMFAAVIVILEGSDSVLDRSL